MKTVFEFVLPQGYVDGQGQVHRQGQMRLATALDEVQSMEDVRVQQNDAYLPIVLLSRRCGWSEIETCISNHIWR